MNPNLKRKILIAPELLTTSVGVFFQNEGFELLSNYDSAIEYEFIVDDFLPEQLTLPRVTFKKTLNPLVQSNVRAEIDLRYLNSELTKELLRKYFSNASNFNLVDHYSSQHKNIFTFKVQDFLNLGYFIDTIVVEAYKQQFNTDKIRNYLNLSLVHALKAVEQQVEDNYVSISFSYSYEAFAVEISFQLPDFALKRELDSIKTLSVDTNYFDLNYFVKRESMSFSAAWFKENDLLNLQASFYTEVTSKSLSSAINAETSILLGPDTNVSYRPVKLIEEQSRKLILARKFSFFIKNYRSQESEPKNSSQLDLNDIENYLANYPRREATEELSDEIKNFILKLVKDENMFDGLSDYVQKVAQKNLDPHVVEVQKSIGRKTLDDIGEIIKIREVGFSKNSDKMVVKGWAENLNEESWHVKRLEIVESIKNEITVIKSRGENIIQDDIVRVMANRLEVSEDQVKDIVSEIVEEVVVTDAVKKEKLEDAYERTFSKEHPGISDEKVTNKLLAQNQKMKKLMELMKNEIIKLREENQNLTNVASMTKRDDSEIVDLKRALGKSMDLVRTNEKVIEKLRGDMEITVQSKNEHISKLEFQLDSLKNKYKEIEVNSNEETIEKLKAENKNLRVRLEVATQKISSPVEKIDKYDTESHLKKDGEILTLKANIQTAQHQVEKLKSEKQELEVKLATERDRYIKLRDTKPTPQNDLNLEHELAISSLTMDKRSLEEKLKLQSIELKKYEQKLKFTNAQLEEAQRKKNAPATITAKSNEAYIKQIELANSRLAEASIEINEKKKEIYRLKQESTSMTSRIAELEKKISYTEKKVA